MGTSKQRNASFSVYYRLLVILKQQGWTYVQEDVPLKLSSGSAYVVDPDHWTDDTIQDSDLPWVYFDENGDPTRQGVRVFDDGAEVSTNDYDVNYLTQEITMNIAVAGDLTARLEVYTVRLREGYPDRTELKQVQLPMVAYDLPSTENRPYAIGRADVWAKRDLVIDILATNEAQRQDLTDQIQRNITRIPYFKFDAEGYINSDGSLNTSFDKDGNFVKSMLVYGRNYPRASYLRQPRGGSDKERWRSIVQLEIQRVE